MISIAVIGNLCIDDVIHPDGRETRDVPGGSALFGALGLRLWTDGVGLVARVGHGYPPDVLQRLRAAGIDTAGAADFDGPAVHNRIDHRPTGGRRLTRIAGSPEANSPRPRDWPPEWNEVVAAHLAAMPVEIQIEWIEFLARRGVTLSLDPHLQSCAEEREMLREVLAQCDFFIPSDLELRMLFPDDPLEEAAGEVDAWTRRGAIIKCGARGAHVPRLGRFLPPCPANVVDETGAGDAYAAAFLWSWAQTGDLIAAHRHGAVSAAFIIEGLGGMHTLSVGPAGAQRRLRHWPEESAQRAER
jgi:sugar/nucleoside kinase (ribokinase family)